MVQKQLTIGQTHFHERKYVKFGGVAKRIHVCRDITRSHIAVRRRSPLERNGSDFGIRMAESTWVRSEVLTTSSSRSIGDPRFELVFRSQVIDLIRFGLGQFRFEPLGDEVAKGVWHRALLCVRDRG